MKIILAAGRYSRSPLSVKRAWKQYSEQAAVTLGTEYHHEERFQALEQGYRGTVIRGKGHAGFRELVIGVAENRTVEHHGQTTLTEKTWERVTGGEAPPRGMVWAQVNGLTVAVAHLAVLGEQKFNGPPTRRILSWKDSVKESAMWSVNRGPLVYGFDYNAPLPVSTDPQVRYLRDVFREVGLHWVTGTRGVCGFFVRDLRVKRCHMLERNASSDHTPMMLVVKK